MKICCLPQSRGAEVHFILPGEFRPSILSQHIQIPPIPLEIFGRDVDAKLVPPTLLEHKENGVEYYMSAYTAKGTETSGLRNVPIEEVIKNRPDLNLTFF